MSLGTCPDGTYPEGGREFSPVTIPVIRDKLITNFSQNVTEPS